MDVKLRHVNREIDRHKVEHFYYRKGKGKRIPLEGKPGTDEFLASYGQAKTADGRPTGKQSIKVTEVRKNTLRWLCVTYFGSAEFMGFEKLEPHALPIWAAPTDRSWRLPAI